jgi:LysR family transcriptional regulator for bpeEF and oprC
MRTTLYAMDVFRRAVEANSFVGAARSLLIDRAAVSRAIKSLEAELGVLLFARSTRALMLTPEGARFYRDCLAILKRCEEATQQFRRDRTIPRGRLVVGMGPGLTRRMLVRSLPEFQQQYPSIEVILLSADDRAEIGHGSIDVLVRARSLRQRGAQHEEPQGVVVRRLAQSQIVVCASPQYLERAGSPRAPADLRDHRCIAFLNVERDIQNEWQFANSRVRQKIKFVPRLLVQGTEALREAGVAGCGIIRSLACHIEDELRSGQLVPVLADWECIGAPPMVAIYRKTKPMPPQISVFVKYLAQAFRRYNLRSQGVEN